MNKHNAIFRHDSLPLHIHQRPTDRSLRIALLDNKGIERSIQCCAPPWGLLSGSTQTHAPTTTTSGSTSIRQQKPRQVATQVAKSAMSWL